MGAQEQTSKDTGKQHKNENALGWWQQITSSTQKTLNVKRRQRAPLMCLLV